MVNLFVLLQNTLKEVIIIFYSFFKSFFYQIKNKALMLFRKDLKISGNTTIEKNAHLKVYGGKIKINNSTIRSGAYFSAVAGGELTIEEGTFFNRNCTIVSRDSITIKKNCLFGPNVTIYDHDHKFSKQGITEGFYKKKILIEEGCWIGANCTILKGTKLGKNSVVGAGVVLSGNYPPNTIIKITKECYKIETITEKRDE